jgi:hypothetical protein
MSYIEKIVNETAEEYMDDYEGWNVMECAKEINNKFAPKVNKATKKRMNYSIAALTISTVLMLTSYKGELVLGKYSIAPPLIAATYLFTTVLKNNEFVFSDYEDRLKQYARERIYARNDQSED